jgi:hypothetical protein
VLPWLASEDPAIFNAYQQSQKPVVEKQLTGAAYLASFIGRKAGEALFAGLYQVAGHRRITEDELRSIPADIELRKLGMKVGDERRAYSLWFDLRLTDVCADWKGKLVVTWPPPEIAYARWANNKNEFKVKAILEESALDKGMPRWDELRLTWEELRKLPKSWASALSEWRGVYYILDGADGKGYVGSAYGDKGDRNIYGRWLNYMNSGDGGNKKLRERAPDRFLFSILERVSPDASSDDVIQREKTWKDRLHTREFGLNAN